MREGGRERGKRDSEWYEVIGWCWKRKLGLQECICVFYTWGHSWTGSLDGCWTSCPAVREMTGLFASTEWLNVCYTACQQNTHKSSSTDRNRSKNDIKDENKMKNKGFSDYYSIHRISCDYICELEAQIISNTYKHFISMRSFLSWQML